MKNEEREQATLVEFRKLEEMLLKYQRERGDGDSISMDQFLLLFMGIVADIMVRLKRLEAKAES